MSEHIGDAELLGFIDAELSEALTATIERHLAECSTCSAQLRAMRCVSADVAALCRDVSVMAKPDARTRLGLRLQAEVERRWTVRAPVVLAVTAALLFVTVRYETTILGRSLFLERGALPMASLTPGAARLISVDDVCAWTAGPPPQVPPALRQQVLRDYGMEHVPQDQYELDYLITPKMGGLTDRRNLWPEPYGLRSWNAHAKDSLENALPRLVCSGRLDLATAQREMASNWIDAYRKYLALERPVQLHARLLLPTEPTRD